MTEQTRIRRVMLDLETIGKRPGCGIVSIGATTFMEGKIETFYDRINPVDARSRFQEDRDTMRWWYNQDRLVYEEAFGGTRPTLDVINDFADWFKKLNLQDPFSTEIWGNGADFDLPILNFVYASFDLPIPWGDYSGRCHRTLKSLLPHVKAPPRAQPKHHALYDAQFEAEYTELLLRVL